MKKAEKIPANMLLLQSPVTTRSVLYHSPFCNNILQNSSNSNLRHNRLRCMSSSASPISTCSPLRTKATSPTIDDDDLKQLNNDAYNESLMMPKHVALIVDGHRRWARDKGVSLQHGYHVGLVNLRQLILCCLRLDGIQVFTVYVFSCKNWTRSKEEVEGLMIIFESLIQHQISEMIKEHNLQFSVIGDKSKLPKSLQKAISSAEASSKGNRGMHLVMALSYSGRYEITEAVKKISRKIEDGTLRARDVDESVIEQHLYTSEIITDTPCPDLLIRTGGESRLSGFMLWQIPYTELYFSGKYLPEFKESDCCFEKRERRFGK